MTILDETIRNLVSRLLASRTPAGHWEGRLASSALSTAVAVSALGLESAGVDRFRSVITGGLEWLARHRNADGGWGDTDLSLSNVSTTCLCWAAFSIAHGGERYAGVVRAAESWLQRSAGGLDADRLTEALLRRYGNDRTFSVPILTVLALAEKLGPDRTAWRRVPQLPFELAACPHQWFQWLRLPVVSYALPALIAIGQVRHQRCPTRNPLTRLLRAWTRQPALRLLERIQPSSGGFLEAIPLTSFVVMSLVASGQASHPVVERGVRFLLQSGRDDGSWPIDTNLATWVTTLSIQALARIPNFSTVLAGQDRRRIRDWLLAQQYTAEHPYTHAGPGGWAWTDLPGGVPDADDTSGALLALKQLAPVDETARRAAASGVRWLLNLQNSDGGIPTFCRGWGKLAFDRSGPDLTAHALLAWTAWLPELSPALRGRVAAAQRRALAFLTHVQRADGSWAPLWFGNQHTPEEENLTYGTSRVLVALAGDVAAESPEVALLRQRGMQWLLEAENPGGGWGGAKGVPSSIEETALAIDALAAQAACGRQAALEPALLRGVQWIVENTECGRRTPPSPIGFYFARLWYFEDLYPLIFAAGGLARARRALGGQDSSEE